MLDNNYDVASSRLRSLKVTLTKSGKLDDYDCAVQKLLQKDHAEVIPEDACVNPQDVVVTPPLCDEEEWFNATCF